MIERINSGELPKQHKIEDLFPGKVIKINRTSRDKNINESIQEEGCHLSRFPDESGGSRSEAEWYKKNKGYSKRIS